MIATSNPTAFPTPFDYEEPFVEITIVVDEILKNDGNLSEEEEITFGTHSHLPSTSSDSATDAANDAPVIWPVDTEFIIFLDEVPGETAYSVTYGVCGRILTDDTNVTCSDADRTILDFMTDLDREEFIEAVQDEVASPHATATMGSTYTPVPTYTLTFTPTPTPTPCSILPCP